MWPAIQLDENLSLTQPFLSLSPTRSELWARQAQVWMQIKIFSDLGQGEQVHEVRAQSFEPGEGQIFSNSLKKPGPPSVFITDFSARPP